MSISAAVNFQGKPINRTLLERMRSAGIRPGAGETEEWFEESAAFMVTRPLPDAGSRDPAIFHDHESGLTVILEGRIDAETELRRALNVQKGATALSPAALVFLAYQRWGNRCAAYLYGDYVFLIWSSKKRELLCARDSSGVAPLFYTQTDDGTLWIAGGANQLLQGPVFSPREDLYGILDLLVGRGCVEPERTPCAQVRRLPAAHVLIASNRELRLHRYWSVFDGESGGANEEELVAKCTEALISTLRDRLTGHSRAGISLSGGWDSGALFSLWMWMRQRGERLPAPFPCNYYYGYPESDERSDVDSLLRPWKIAAVYSRVENEDGLIGLHQHVFDLGLPELGFGWQERRKQARCLASRGVSLIITGDGGNFVVQSSLLNAAEMVAGKRLVSAWRQMHVWSKELDRPAHRLFWPYVIRPLIPLLWPRLWNAAKKVRTSLHPSGGILPFLDPKLAGTLAEWTAHHAVNARQKAQRCSLSDWDKRFQLDQFLRTVYPLYPSPALEGIEQSAPYLDRRVIESCLNALVFLEKSGPSRRLLAQILSQTTKTRPRGNYKIMDRAMEEGLKAQLLKGNPFFQATTLIELRIVDQNLLTRFLSDFASGKNRSSDELWRLVSMEAWARCWLRGEKPTLSHDDCLRESIGQPSQFFMA
ncbi:MAG: hypothetical protein HY645_03925 [Acidobacteria bacterium]|nr:hypothetical protein [Acidobacteriota bacterium]